MARRTVARRRRRPDAIKTALERELGIVHEQLELPTNVPERSAISVRSFAPKPACSECGRRGYHLTRCSRKEVNI